MKEGVALFAGRGDAGAAHHPNVRGRLTAEAAADLVMQLHLTTYPDNLVLGCDDPTALNCIGFTVHTLSLGQLGSRYYLETSGTLTLRTDLPVIGDILSQDIELHALRIWSDGSVDFDGGSFVLPEDQRLAYYSLSRCPAPTAAKRTGSAPSSLSLFRSIPGLNSSSPRGCVINPNSQAHPHRNKP